MSTNSPVDFEFTDAQRWLITATGSLFVEACPGAGKTQSVVQRFIERPNVLDRRGVAFLAFTNAAVDDATSRCIGQPHLMQVPNFLGTIDAFINRFIVGPVFRWKFGQWPSIKRSWEAVPDTGFNVPAARRAFQLDWFSMRDGQAEFALERVPANQRHSFSQLKNHQIRAANVEATKLHVKLTQNGVLDSNSARLLMWEYLDDAIVGGRLALLLEARFREVIVDEVQDCSPDDIRLIEFLLDSGIEIVMVGDLEQEIFGFRGAATEGIRRLKSRVPVGQRMAENFRSSPDICRLIDSLRHGPEKDLPRGPHSTDDTPIHLLRTLAQGDHQARILDIAQSLGISDSEVVVLAYRRTDAQRFAGESSVQNTSANRLVRLARACNSVTDHTANVRSKRLATEQVGVILRELARSELRFLSDERFLEAVSMDHASYNAGLVGLALQGDPFVDKPSHFKAKIKQGLAALGWDLWVNSSALQTPKGDAWENSERRSSGVLRADTIHSYKGLQAPAIAIVLPRVTKGREFAVKHWKDGSPDEARRVLYVGASRAQRLLMLAVHESQWDCVLYCMDRDDVPYVAHV